jgi:hypothetical protein
VGILSPAFNAILLFVLLLLVCVRVCVYELSRSLAQESERVLNVLWGLCVTLLCWLTRCVSSCVLSLVVVSHAHLKYLGPFAEGQRARGRRAGPFAPRALLDPDPDRTLSPFGWEQGPTQQGEGV